MPHPRPNGKQPRRRHSWPPLHVHVFKNHHNINDDPFSFFISPPDASLVTAVEDLSAGIQTGRRARSVSPFKRQGDSAARPKSRTISHLTKLFKWIERMERQYGVRYGVHRQHSPARGNYSPEMQSPSPPPLSPSSFSPPSPRVPELRGREPSQRNLRGSPKRPSHRVRSHSGKPRIWQEPGDSIYPLAEEQEDGGLAIRF
ncbi:hypothetical protein MMC25_005365 [Agyrium rufum]|nr:hypothetical protein [Agyrium rufum]